MGWEEGYAQCRVVECLVSFILPLGLIRCMQCATHSHSCHTNMGKGYVTASSGYSRCGVVSVVRYIQCMKYMYVHTYKVIHIIAYDTSIYYIICSSSHNLLPLPTVPGWVTWLQYCRQMNFPRMWQGQRLCSPHTLNTKQRLMPDKTPSPASRKMLKPSLLPDIMPAKR